MPENISKPHRLNRKIENLKRLRIFTQNKRKADFFLLFIIFILTGVGLIMVYDASIVEANLQFHDKFYYLKYQAAYAVLGWVGLLIAGHIDYHIYKRFIKWLFLANVFLLILVLIPHVGLRIKGASRWLDLGFVTFQPSETLKTILVLYLATWLEKKRTLQQFFAIVGAIAGLVVFEPDLGTAIVLIGTAFVIYYISGAPVVKFALGTFAALLVGLLLIISSPYRRDRMTTFLNPQNDTLGTSYHVQQIHIALGSGGIKGVGIGQSKQKYQYLPEATSDSIFAIYAEEMGFVGGLLLIACFLVIIWKGFQIAQLAPDIHGRLIATGITTWIAAQIFVNLSSMVSLTPLTGIPLPLFSYGGTALVVTLVSVGILLNISKQTVQKDRPSLASAA